MHLTGKKKIKFLLTPSVSFSSSSSSSSSSSFSSSSLSNLGQKCVCVRACARGWQGRKWGVFLLTPTSISFQETTSLHQLHTILSL